MKSSPYPFVSRLGQLMKGHYNATLWFTVASAIPAVAGLILGPINLRLVGLENYALISLVGYFYASALGYSDFGINSHLLAAYSKSAATRHKDLGNAIVLKFLLISLFSIFLIYFCLTKQRSDPFYLLLGISMSALILPSMNIEWYFIAKGKNRDLFIGRAIMLCSQFLLTGCWFISGKTSAVFPILIGVLSASASSIFLLEKIGRHRFFFAIKSLKQFSIFGLLRLVYKLFPVAATQVISPYFLAYALPWYSLILNDTKQVGSFSISYRLIMGFMGLVGPFVLFSITKSSKASAQINWKKAFSISSTVSTLMWATGIPIICFFFWVGHVNFDLFPHAAKVFSILMIGIFLQCYRTPYVSRFLATSRYLEFFVIHLFSCLPTLAISIFFREQTKISWIPWLACVPEALATTFFVVFSRKVMHRNISGHEH